MEQMMRIFLDTNVILDWLLGREGAEASMGVFSYAQGKRYVREYTSLLSMANIAYICRRNYQPSEIRNVLRKVLKYLSNVLAMSDMVFYNALECKSPDFEDSLQIQCAEFECCDVIITRNVSHFKAYTPLPVMTPEEFLSLMGKSATV